MNEQDFWWELRCLINSREPDERSAHAKLGFCDWFELQGSEFGPFKPQMQGRIGFVNGQDVSQWRFTLFLVLGTESEEQIRWHELLPAAPEGPWLKFDEYTKTVTINPSGA